MLVLSRRSKQSITIGDGIVVTILGVKGKRITVGIDAPDDVQIRRGELPAPPQAAHPQPCEEQERKLDSCPAPVAMSELTTMLVTE